jgi:hypothetical protein
MAAERPHLHQGGACGVFAGFFGFFEKTQK